MGEVVDFFTGKEEWNPDLESVIKREGEQSQSLFWLHNEASKWAALQNDAIQIPTIILASVTGFLSATSYLIPPIGIGAMSLSAGLLNTINSYFRFSQQSEAHRVTAQLYLKTFKNIEMELALPIYQRESANTLLKDLRQTMLRISEVAPSIPSTIIDKYNRVFKASKVSAPIITNGIVEIEVCKIDKVSVKAEQNIISTTPPRAVSPITLSNSSQTNPWPSAVSSRSPKQATIRT